MGKLLLLILLFVSTTCGSQVYTSKIQLVVYKDSMVTLNHSCRISIFKNTQETIIKIYGESELNFRVYVDPDLEKNGPNGLRSEYYCCYDRGLNVIIEMVFKDGYLIQINFIRKTLVTMYSINPLVMWI